MFKINFMSHVKVKVYELKLLHLFASFLFCFSFKVKGDIDRIARKVICGGKNAWSFNDFFSAVKMAWNMQSHITSQPMPHSC